MMAKYRGTIMKIKNKILFFIETYTTIYQLCVVRKYWQLKLHNAVFFYKNTTILFAIDTLLSNLFSSTYSNGVRKSVFAGAVRLVGVTRTNVFVNLIPVFTAILSWFILDEMLTMSKWIGILIVVVGLFVSQAGKIIFNKEVEKTI